MKKYTLFLFVFFLSFILLGFNVNSANAYDSGCTAAGPYSTTTGLLCSSAPVTTDCKIGDLFSSLTGKPCIGATLTDLQTKVAVLLDNLFKRELSQGTTGEDVKALQQILTDAGFLLDTVDGIFGPITKVALIQYQNYHNLTATGKLDASTLQIIKTTPALITCYSLHEKSGFNSTCPVYLATTGTNNTIPVQPVVLPNTPPTITTSSLPSGKTNRAYAASVEAAVVSEVGGNYSWSASGLPNGLSIAGCAAAICRNHGKITGAPTAGGNFKVTVTVTAGGKSSSKTFSLFIDTCDCSPDGSENPTTGACVGNQKGTNTRVYTCDCHWEVNWSKEVDNCSKTECLDGYAPYYTAAGMICTKGIGGTGDLAITTASPLPSGTVGSAYTAYISGSGGKAGYSWSTMEGYELPPGSLKNTSSTTVELSGTPTQAGTFKVGIKLTSGSESISKIFDLVNVAAGTDGTGDLTITTPSPLPSGTFHVSYPATTLSATGGSDSYVWSFATEPGCFILPWLSISSSGVITGYPTTSGSAYICIKVSSGVVNTFKQFFLSIASVPGE